MANLDIDTRKIREAGISMINLANELGSNINDLFERLEKIPTVSCEWVGESAMEFSRIANAEKIDYVNLKNNLYNYGKFLVNTAEDMERAQQECSYNG